MIWLSACSIGPIYALPVARATVMAAIAITYALLAVLELWRGPGQEASRWPIMLLLLGHAAASRSVFRLPDQRPILIPSM